MTESRSKSVLSLYTYDFTDPKPAQQQKEHKEDVKKSKKDDDLETVLDVHDDYLPYDESGKRVYENACKKFGIVPVSAFLKNLAYSKVIDLKHYGLGPRGAMAVSFALCVNSRVSTLILRGNDLGAEGIEHVRRMMMENINITDLDIAENRLGNAGAVAVYEILHYNKYVKRLDISGNEFTDADAKYIATAVEDHGQILNLNLSHNRFSDNSADAFSKMLVENNSLSELDLSWNEFRMAGAAKLAKGLADNTTIRNLDVSWNGLDDDGATAFGEALESNAVLTQLDISSNRIGPEGFMKLLNAFKTNSTLETLRIGKNNIPEECITLAVELLKDVEDFTLQLLDLSDVIFSDRVIPKIEELKEAHEGMEVIYGYTDSYGKKKKGGYDVVKDALQVIDNYLEEEGISLVDLFSRFDDDGSMSVSHDEFKQGIKESGIRLTPYQVDMLIDYIDEDGDGEIDFSEIVVQTQRSRAS